MSPAAQSSCPAAPSAPAPCSPSSPRTPAPTPCCMPTPTCRCGSTHRRPSARPQQHRSHLNGDTIIRPHRTGTRSGTRAFACSASRLSGSGRPGGGSNTAWLSRGTWARAALPRSARSAGVSRPSPESSWYRNAPGAEPPPSAHLSSAPLLAREDGLCLALQVDVGVAADVDRDSLDRAAGEGVRVGAWVVAGDRLAAVPADAQALARDRERPAASPPTVLPGAATRTVPAHPLPPHLHPART